MTALFRSQSYNTWTLRDLDGPMDLAFAVSLKEKYMKLKILVLLSAFRNILMSMASSHIITVSHCPKL